MKSDKPLTVTIENGILTISVGIDVIKWATEHMDVNMPWDEKINDYKRLWVVTDPLEFAKAVRHELLREEEDGTTSIDLLLDKVCLAAIESGCEGVDDASDVDAE